MKKASLSLVLLFASGSALASVTGGLLSSGGSISVMNVPSVHIHVNTPGPGSFPALQSQCEADLLYAAQKLVSAGYTILVQDAGCSYRPAQGGTGGPSPAFYEASIQFTK